MPSDAIRVRPLAGDALAVEVDLAAAGAVDAADAVEHRGLAGAVGPDQREQLAAPRGERHVVEHLQAAERERDARPSAELSHTSGGCGGTA